MDVPGHDAPKYSYHRFRSTFFRVSAAQQAGASPLGGGERRRLPAGREALAKGRANSELRAVAEAYG